MSINALHTEPPIARFSNGKIVRGGPVIATVSRCSKMLTPSQRERLQILHAYEWVDKNPGTTRQNLEILFNAIETAEEL